MSNTQETLRQRIQNLLDAAGTNLETTRQALPKQTKGGLDTGTAYARAKNRFRALSCIAAMDEACYAMGKAGFNKTGYMSFMDYRSHLEGQYGILIYRIPYEKHPDYCLPQFLADLMGAILPAWEEDMETVSLSHPFHISTSDTYGIWFCKDTGQGASFRVWVPFPGKEAKPEKPNFLPEKGTDWFQEITDRLRDYPEGEAWTDGDEILCRTKDGMDAILDVLATMYRSQRDEMGFVTGYYDPEEDKRNNEEDRYTGWYYLYPQH